MKIQLLASRCVFKYQHKVGSSGGGAGGGGTRQKVKAVEQRFRCYLRANSRVWMRDGAEICNEDSGITPLSFSRDAR
jgi:hypothetical protein